MMIKTDVSHSRSAMEVKSFMCMMNDTVTQRLFMRMGQKSIISIMKKTSVSVKQTGWEELREWHMITVVISHRWWML